MKNEQSLEAVHTHTHGYSLKNNRIIYLDILNIIAIIAVVALHCNGIVHGNPNTRAWSTSLIIECLFYFAVPIFFMISGANLMKYREKYDTKTFFKKRFFKVFIPFIFWAIIMFIWRIFITKGIKIEQINSPVKLINAFFSNKEESTYYFMFLILGVYLAFPLLSLLTKKEYRKTLWGTVIIFFIFNALVPNICALLKINWNSSLELPISGYVIYAILGYLLSETELNKKQKIGIHIGTIIGLIFRYISTYILSKEAGTVIKTTWGNTQWHCILLSMSVFIIIKDLKIYERIGKSEKLKNIIKEIAGCSFGIYLIHMIVKHYLVKIFNINVLSWEFRTLGIILVYCTSLAIVWILKKVPIAKKVLP